MNFNAWETTKVVFAGFGGLLLVYQAFALFNSNAPLRLLVNPIRRQAFIAGAGLLSMAYGALAILAGNKWMPEDVLHVLAPLFNEQSTPVKVVIAVIVAGFGVGVLGSALFCYRCYPRDPKSFVPEQRYPAATLAAAKRALRHYTNQRGGLEYAAVIVLPADGTVPNAEQLLATAQATTVAVGSCWLIERTDTGDVSRNDRKRERHRANEAELIRRRVGWLSLAADALQETRRLGERARLCDLGAVTQARLKTRLGGMIFEPLLPNAGGEREVVLFGVTTSADEVANGRLEQHFGMLREALSHIIRDQHDLGDAPPSPSQLLTATTATVPQLPAG